jgi:molybdate transport system substrate-binding protein
MVTAVRRSSRLVLTVVSVLGLVGASCGSDSSSKSTSAPTTAAATTVASSTVVASSVVGLSGGVTVFAASSLTESFNEIAAAFMVEHPDVKVTLSFGASSDLVAQIGQGAPADVFASADEANMQKVSDAGEVGGVPVVFATNSLEIIVGAGNPKGVGGVADLAKPDLIVVNCDPAVPIGKYSAQVLANAGVSVTPKSLEQNVKGIVTKVTSGEADAGIVYKTDVSAAGAKAAGVEIPADINVVAKYPIAVTKAAPNAVVGAAFVSFVEDEQGQKILASHGFTAP